MRIMCKDILVNKATTQMGHITTEQSVTLQTISFLSFTADFPVTSLIHLQTALLMCKSQKVLCLNSPQAPFYPRLCIT